MVSENPEAICSSHSPHLAVIFLHLVDFLGGFPSLKGRGDNLALQLPNCTRHYSNPHCLHLSEGIKGSAQSLPTWGKTKGSSSLVYYQNQIIFPQRMFGPRSSQD